MRPLELTVYPHNKRHLNTNWMVMYDTPNGPRAAGRGGVLPAAKHLTDAELAAEYWAAQSDFLQGATFITSDELARERIDLLTETQSRSTTLNRFATHPHYFEEAA